MRPLRPPRAPGAGTPGSAELLDDLDADLRAVTLSGADLSGRLLAARSFDDVTISSSRCTGTTFERCQFDTIVFRDCELSAVTFSECSLRNVVIVGGKASSFVVLDDCSIDGLWLRGVTMGDLTVSSCTFRGDLVVADSTAEVVTFDRCRARGDAARVVLSELRAERLEGVEQLAAASIEPLLEETLWRELAAFRLRAANVESLDVDQQETLDATLRELGT